MSERQPLESIEDLGFRRKAYAMVRIFDYSTQPARERIEYGWLKVLDFAKNAVYLMVGERALKVEGVESIDEILLSAETGLFINPAKAMQWALIAFIFYTYTILAFVGNLPWIGDFWFTMSLWVPVLSWGYVWYSTPSFEIILEHKSYEKSLDPRLIFEVCVPAVNLRYGFVRNRLKLLEIQVARLESWVKKYGSKVFNASSGAAYNRMETLLESIKKGIEEEIEKVKQSNAVLSTEHQVLKAAFEEQKESLDTVVDVDFEMRTSEILRRYGVLSREYRPQTLPKQWIYLFAGILIGIIVLVLFFSGGG